MKNILYISVIVSLITGCTIKNDVIKVEKNLIINDSTRELISGLNNPVVDYVLNKDGEEYLSKTDELLTAVDGTYVITFDLYSGSDYKFTEFTIKSNDSIEYILDIDSLSNNEGFNISIDGVFSVTPKVYLKKVTGIVFDTLNYETLSVEIITDQSSYLDPVPLTFKISSNIPDATFHIYKYTIYWVTGPELNQNEIFDMDTGLLFDPLEDGDEDPWGSGKFKIVTTNSIGESVFVVGFCDEWSTKHIHLELE